MSDNKRIAQNTLYLYLRMFLIMAVSLFTVRIILKTLSVEDYGIYSAVGGIVISFSFISNVLASASQRFFSFELGRGNNENIHKVFSTIFITYLLVILVIIITAETFGVWFLEHKMEIPNNRENAAYWVFQCSLLSFIIGVLANPFQAFIIAKEKMNIYAYLSILDVVLKLLVVYILTSFVYDKLKLYAVLICISTFITNIIYVIYCRNKYPEIKFDLNIDKQILKSVFSYSSWTFFGTISGICNTQGVNLLLNLFFGPIANAAYAISNQVYNAISSFANNFYTAIRPPLIKSYSKSDYIHVEKLFSISSKCIFLFMYILILPLLLNTNTILKFWLGTVGPYMTSFVQLSLIYSLILSMSNPITTIVQATGHVRLYYGLVDGFALLSFPFSYILFRSGYDPNYAFYTMIIIFAIAHFLRLYVLIKVFPTITLHSYFFKIIVPMLIVALISYFISRIFAFSTINQLWSTCLNALLTSIVVLLLSLFVLFDNIERCAILYILKKTRICQYLKIRFC